MRAILPLVLAAIAGAAIPRSSKAAMNREALEKFVSDHIDEIQRCYERELDKNKTVQGKIVVEWVIEPEGKVTRAREKSSSVRQPGLSRCIVAVISGWRFPKSKSGPIKVEFPFSFFKAAES